MQLIWSKITVNICKNHKMICRLYILRCNIIIKIQRDEFTHCDTLIQILCKNMSIKCMGNAWMSIIATFVSSLCIHLKCTEVICKHFINQLWLELMEEFIFVVEWASCFDVWDNNPFIVQFMRERVTMIYNCQGYHLTCSLHCGLPVIKNINQEPLVTRWVLT